MIKMYLLFTLGGIAMKKQLFLLLSFLLITAIVLSGCGGGSPSVQVKTIEYQDDGNGFTQFYTNDKRNYNYSFWHSDLTPQETMFPVEIQVKKLSGNKSMVHGAFFCYKDDHNFYRVVIDTEGNYYIFKHNSNGTEPRTTIRGKTASPNLNTGYNTLNTIHVERDDEGQFTIKFNNNYKNDTEVITFEDTTFTGGRCGFYVAVGDETQEQFPNTPVDVRFKQILPEGASI